MVAGAPRSQPPTYTLMAQLSREPLRHLFLELVEKNYSVVGLRNRQLTEYVVALLDDFSSAATLYRIRNVAGKPLDTVAEMLDVCLPQPEDAHSLEHERCVRQHIGDFALFFTGMFPESVGARRRGRACESLIDYVKTGKESYRRVSEYERAHRHPPTPRRLPGEPESGRHEELDAAVFAQLAAEFERCMVGLNLVKSELRSFSDPIYAEVRHLLERSQ